MLNASRVLVALLVKNIAKSAWTPGSRWAVHSQTSKFPSQNQPNVQLVAENQPNLHLLNVCIAEIL